MSAGTAAMENSVEGPQGTEWNWRCSSLLLGVYLKEVAFLKRVLCVRVDVSTAAAALVAVAKIRKCLQCRLVGERMAKMWPTRVRRDP